MRARHFQFSFDRLDSRLLLDGSGLPPSVPYPGDEIDLVAAFAAANPGPEYPLDGGGVSGGGDSSSTFVPPDPGTMIPTTPSTT